VVSGCTGLDASTDTNTNANTNTYLCETVSACWLGVDACRCVLRDIVFRSECITQRNTNTNTNTNINTNSYIAQTLTLTLTLTTLKQLTLTLTLVDLHGCTHLTDTDIHTLSRSHSLSSSLSSLSLGGCFFLTVDSVGVSVSGMDA